MHSERGPLSLAQILTTFADHVESHARQMQAIREAYKQGQGEEMTRLRWWAGVLLAVAALAGDAPTDGQRWWSHIVFLADDKLEGRNTGSEGYRKAAAYVQGEFERAGLRPGGTDGYFQPVKFNSRQIVERDSSLTLVRDGKAEPLTLGEDALISLRVDPAKSVGGAAGVCRIRVDGAGDEVRRFRGAGCARQDRGVCWRRAVVDSRAAELALSIGGGTRKVSGARGGGRHMRHCQPNCHGCALVAGRACRDFNRRCRSIMRTSTNRLGRSWA